MIKKILIILALSMTWLLGIAQLQNTKHFIYSANESFSFKNDYQVLIDKIGRVYDWGISGRTCSGCPSFYTKVIRTTYPVDGKYTYMVYFFSNSYNVYGYLAGTYLRGISINKSNSLGEMENIMFLEYFLINPKNNYFDGVNLVATFFSYNPNDIVVLILV